MGSLPSRHIYPLCVAPPKYLPPATRLIAHCTPLLVSWWVFPAAPAGAERSPARGGGPIHICFVQEFPGPTGRPADRAGNCFFSFPAPASPRSPFLPSQRTVGELPIHFGP